MKCKECKKDLTPVYTKIFDYISYDGTASTSASYVTDGKEASVTYSRGVVYPANNEDSGTTTVTGTTIDHEMTGWVACKPCNRIMNATEI